MLKNYWIFKKNYPVVVSTLDDCFEFCLVFCEEPPELELDDCEVSFELEVSVVVSTLDLLDCEEG